MEPSPFPLELEVIPPVERVDLRTPYLKRIRQLVDPKRLTASKIHAVVDSMYGSAFGYVGELLRCLFQRHRDSEW